MASQGAVHTKAGELDKRYMFTRATNQFNADFEAASNFTDFNTEVLKSNGWDSMDTVPKELLGDYLSFVDDEWAALTSQEENAVDANMEDEDENTIVNDPDSAYIITFEDIEDAMDAVDVLDGFGFADIEFVSEDQLVIRISEIEGVLEINDFIDVLESNGIVPEDYEYDDDGLDEARPKAVYKRSGGAMKKVLRCAKGYKLKGKQCVRQSGDEKVRHKRTARKITRKIKSKGVGMQKRAARKRSVTKRRASGRNRTIGK